MFLCMYICWVVDYGMKCVLISESLGEEVGIKFVMIEIKGMNVFGWFKMESGVYCLVCILLFDVNVCWYMSFVSVWVYFVIDDLIEIDVFEKDVCIDMYCVSGVGG